MIRTGNNGSNICTKCGLYNGPELLNNIRGGGSGWDKVWQGLNQNRCLCEKDVRENSNTLNKMNKKTTIQPDSTREHTISELFKKRNKILFSVLLMNLILGVFVYLFHPFIDPNFFQYEYLAWGDQDVGESYGIHYIPNPIYLGQLSLIWFLYYFQVRKYAKYYRWGDASTGLRAREPKLSPFNDYMNQTSTEVKFYFVLLIFIFSIITLIAGPIASGAVFNCMLITIFCLLGVALLEGMGPPPGEIVVKQKWEAGGTPKIVYERKIK